MATRKSIFERFWEKVIVINDEDSCWEWQATKLPKGYGRFSKGYAHRFSYEHYVGVIPFGLLVCHSCDNPKCIRPKHLFAGTHKNNWEDCLNKGRNPRGERYAHSRLTDEKVRLIRSLNLTHQQIADQLKIPRRTVSHVKSGKNWKHVK